MTAAVAIDPPFERVGIAGLGLIGGSIALAVRARWPATSILAFDRVLGPGAPSPISIVDTLATDLAELASCDLIVLAVPLSAMTDVMRELAATRTRAVVTDVGSTKRRVLREAAAAGLVNFVGGHPMAGSERGGLGHANADLFVGRPWLIVPGNASADAAARVAAFARGLGARTHQMDADAHDRAVAYVSHLPQVLGVALMNAAHAALGDDPIATTGGRAFAEMTRLGSSPSSMWREILDDNADFVGEAVRDLLRQLPDDETALRARRWVDESFARAAAARERWLATQPTRE